jgi:hypothetical protein
MKTDRQFPPERILAPFVDSRRCDLRHNARVGEKNDGVVRVAKHARAGGAQPFAARDFARGLERRLLPREGRLIPGRHSC